MPFINKCCVLQLQNNFSDSRFFNSFSDCTLQDCAPLPYTVWPTQGDCKSVDWPQVMPNNRLFFIFTHINNTRFGSNCKLLTILTVKTAIQRGFVVK